MFNKIDMISHEEINKKTDIFRKKIKKKIYTISALKHKGLKVLQIALQEKKQMEAKVKVFGYGYNLK